MVLLLSIVLGYLCDAKLSFFCITFKRGVKLLCDGVLGSLSTCIVLCGIYPFVGFPTYSGSCFVMSFGSGRFGFVMVLGFKVLGVVTSLLMPNVWVACQSQQSHVARLDWLYIECCQR